MNEKFSKLIIYVFGIILLFTQLSSVVISNDVHIFDCEQATCSKCLFINNMRESVKNFFVIASIVVVYVISNLIGKILMILKGAVVINPIFLKVQLNE